MRVLLLCLLCNSICIANGLTSELQDYFSKACQSKTFMRVAALSLNGATIFSQACGWADAELNVRNSTATRFRTGSIAKQFTAAGALLLHENGKLHLFLTQSDNNLPDLPKSLREIDSSLLSFVTARGDGASCDKFHTGCRQDQSASMRKHNNRVIFFISSE